MVVVETAGGGGRPRVVYPSLGAGIFVCRWGWRWFERVQLSFIKNETLATHEASDKDVGQVGTDPYNKQHLPPRGVQQSRYKVRRNTQ